MTLGFQSKSYTILPWSAIVSVICFSLAANAFFVARLPCGLDDFGLNTLNSFRNITESPPKARNKEFFICIGIEIRAFPTWIGYHAWLWELSPEMLGGNIFVLKFSLDSLSFFTVSSYVDRGSWSLWNLLLYLYSIEFPFSLSICFDVSCKLFSDILPLLPDLYSCTGPSPQMNGQLGFRVSILHSFCL